MPVKPQVMRIGPRGPRVSAASAAVTRRPQTGRERTGLAVLQKRCFRALNLRFVYFSCVTKQWFSFDFRFNHVRAAGGLVHRLQFAEPRAL